MEEVLDISEMVRRTGAKGFREKGAAFEGEAKPPFSREVMGFILAASAAKPA